MCGIFAYRGTYYKKNVLEMYIDRLGHRGPDYNENRQLTHDLLLGFHRLAINDCTDNSNQPIDIDRCTLICNGEIYNHVTLKEEHNLKNKTGSDCEVIIHLYRKYGIDRCVKMLDGVFAFLLYDHSTQETIVARDPLGIRPLYRTDAVYGEWAIASESKALLFSRNRISQFPPGCYRIDSQNPVRYKKLSWVPAVIPLDESIIKKRIYNSLWSAVSKRLMADREIGCLLSGGIDSSIIVSLASELLREKGIKLKTFSIGLSGSPDLVYAKKVAEFCNTEHYSVEVTEKEMIDAIPDVIYALGSYDVTTIRASLGNYLIAQYIKENTDVKVLLTGEVADELSGSYLYFQNAPSSKAFHAECERLLQDISYFDVKRCDACISAHSIEARVPFGDISFIDMYMTELTTEQKQGDLEKRLLREAFRGKLPDDVLIRKKNGFSNSVSEKNRDLATILGEYIKVFHNSSEKSWYRRLFEYGSYEGHTSLTPYQWLPKWSGDIKDPSARLLDQYKAD